MFYCKSAQFFLCLALLMSGALTPRLAGAQAVCSSIGALEARLKALNLLPPSNGFLSNKSFSKQFAGFSLDGVDSAEKIFSMNAVGFHVIHIGWKTNIAFDPSIREKEVDFIGGLSTSLGRRDYVAARTRLNFVKLHAWCARGWALLSDGSVEVYLAWDEGGVWKHEHRLVFVRSHSGRYSYLLNEMTPVAMR